MPVDPMTGERLPYAGEPGAPAGAPPMPPGGPEMPPGAGADPVADDAMRSIEEEQAARMQAVASSAPVPSEAYDVKLINKLVEELNALASKALGEGAVPEIVFDAEGDTKWAQPLPGNVFVPLVAVNEMATEMGFDKYTFDPVELGSNAGLRSAAAKIRQMHSDENFIDAVTQAPEEAEPAMEEGDEELPPGEFSDEDRELMEAMPEEDLMTA
jgi:hypothetical protein